MVKELAKIYLKNNYSLVVNGTKEKGFDEFKNNKDIKIVLGDITKEETRSKIFDEVKKLGRIDVLVNNAGIIYIQPFENNTEEQLDQLLAVDLKAPIMLTQKLYPLFVEQGSGTIININSTAGKEAKLDHTLYNAAKFGLSGFTNSLRIEAKAKGIRVLGFHPGGMATEFYDTLDTPPDLSKFMRPSTVADAIFYLSELEGISPDEVVINRLSR